MEPPSSPLSGSASPEEALAWYKTQYEQLESELADFKESSMELERELEQDIEEAEKRERSLQDRAEAIGFEVEEWKVCAFFFFFFFLWGWQVSFILSLLMHLQYKTIHTH